MLLLEFLTLILIVTGQIGVKQFLKYFPHIDSWPNSMPIFWSLSQIKHTNLLLETFHSGLNLISFVKIDPQWTKLLQISRNYKILGFFYSTNINFTSFVCLIKFLLKIKLNLVANWIFLNFMGLLKCILIQTSSFR